MNLGSFNQNIYIFLCFILLLLTNSYFSYEESLVFGASDGFDYFTIAHELGNIPQETLNYHKAWRFVIPSLVGFISKFFDLNTYLTFRIFAIIGSLSAIYIFNSILKKLKYENSHIFFLSLIFIFNPYLFRYFIANPTMLNDLIFVNSALLIVLSYIKKDKKLFYVGLLLGLLTRQNAIFYLISLILIKIIFKNNSFFRLKDIIFSIILTLLIFSINNNFANLYTEYNEAYSFINRFNLLTFNYSINEFIIYNLFLLIIIIPIFAYAFAERKIFLKKKIKSEFYLLVFFIVFFICSIAYVNGPNMTGRNLIRLCNLVYPLIMLLVIYPFKLNTNKNIGYKYIYVPIIFLWSLHPTFSNIKSYLFEF
tara:strand:+ start:1757 stop:2854 length:1098 start_codon:yes stop_codon:yes gene_type:complete